MRPREAEEECYQRTLRIARLHLPTTQLHPGITILQGERETFFFFFFRQCISQGGVSIHLNMDVWEALTQHQQETGLVLPAITPFCADWVTLLPEKINGSFEQFHNQHLTHTASSQNGASRTLLALREREKRKIEPDNMFFTYTLKI